MGKRRKSRDSETWEALSRESRENAIQCLNQWELTGTAPELILHEYWGMPDRSGNGESHDHTGADIEQVSETPDDLRVRLEHAGICCTDSILVEISRRKRRYDQVALVDRIVFATSLVLGTVAHVEEIDAMISEYARHWRMNRLGLVEKSILRLGGYELFYEEETPAAVIIDEAVELAKRFSDPEAGSFVNGVLDGMSKHTGT